MARGIHNIDGTRKNKDSKKQESEIILAVKDAFEIIKAEYPDNSFNYETDCFSPKDAVEYINRFQSKNNLDIIDSNLLDSIDTAKGIQPDGGICSIIGNDGFNHIILISEAKHQGRYDGYTPKSDSAWKKDKSDGKYPNLPLDTPYELRPPQGLGNAVERIFKNANTIECLTTVYGYFPYVAFCDGYDFHTKEDFHIFAHQPFAKETDSSIRMRLVTGNKFVPLNNSYVLGIKRGFNTVYPVSIYARMQKWTHQEMVDVFLDVMRESINHLIAIDEV